MRFEGSEAGLASSSPLELDIDIELIGPVPSKFSPSCGLVKPGASGVTSSCWVVTFGASGLAVGVEDSFAFDATVSAADLDSFGSFCFLVR